MPFSLLPKAIAGDITKITPEYLEGQGIRLLMMDFDNTIVPYTTDTPTGEVVQWLEMMKKSPVKANFAHRGNIFLIFRDREKHFSCFSLHISSWCFPAGAAGRWHGR